MGEKALQNEEILKMIGAQLLKVNNASTERFDLFTPGIYTRFLRMQGDAVFLTEKHNSQHPFFILYGSLHVWNEENGWELMSNPKFGITVPGTQRLFRTYTDVVWVTTHATDIYPEDDSKEAHAKAVKSITERIIQKVDNPYIDTSKETEVLE